MYCPLGLFFGPPGFAELMIVALVVLLLFGKRLPSVMGSLGRSVVEFKKGISGIEDEVNKVKHDVNDAVDEAAKTERSAKDA